MHPTATGRYLFSLLMAMFLLMGASTAQAQVVVNENGDFEQSEVGQTSNILNWGLWFEGTGGATAEVVEDPDDATNKVLRGELVDTSQASRAWDFQVGHYGGNELALVEGHEYQVSVRIRAENPDVANVNLDGGANAQIWGRGISGTGWTTLESGTFVAGEGETRSF